jgi:hypothetical protein
MNRFQRWQRQVWRLISLVTIIVLILGMALPVGAAPLADFGDLRTYATQMKPLVEDAIELAREDAAILREARTGDPDAVCDGRLAANAEALARLRGQMAVVVPPPEVAEVHDRLMASSNDYGRGVSTVLNYCATGDRRQLARGVLTLAAARLKFGGAIVEFDLLLLQSGLEELMARYPGSDFEALVEYGTAVGPDYQAWAELIAAEGPVIQAAHDGHPEELCTANIVGDMPRMQAIVSAFEAVAVPEAATEVHQLLLGGAKAWLEGLRYSGEYCAADQEWQKNLYLGLALLGFDVGAAGFASATVAYSDALMKAWQDLMRDT